MMRTALGLLCLPLVLLAASAAWAAEPIVLKRGLPTDIWLSWPEKDALASESVVNIFPEFRKEYKGWEFKAAKQAGFDFIRLTVDPAPFLSNPGPARTKKLLGGVSQAVDDILAADLKVVVDMHSIPRSDGAPGTAQILDSKPLFENYANILETIVHDLSRHAPGKLAFELLNEPTVDCDAIDDKSVKAVWPDMLAVLHKRARKAAPLHTLILSGACWGGSEGLVRLNPKTFDDQNIIWSFHNYEPFVFTHQSADWSDGYIVFVKDLHYPPTRADQKKHVSATLKAISTSRLKASEKKRMAKDARYDLSNYFKPGWAEDKALEPIREVVEWAQEHGVPRHRILMGEFGAIRAENDTPLKRKGRYLYYRQVRTAAERAGFAWSTWSWSGTMGLSTRFNNREFDPEMMQALGLNKQ